MKMSVKELHIDEDLFQDMVDFYIKLHGFPPLAAKLYALLSFDYQRKGMEFNELVEFFQSSKGAVSSYLKILLSQKLVLAVNRLGERRRLFIVNPDYLGIRFSEVLDLLKHEKRLIQKWKVHKQKYNIINEDLDGKFRCFEEAIDEITEKIEKIIDEV